MAITNASRLADFGSGIGTAGAVLQIDNANDRIGIGTTNPSNTLQVGIGITMNGVTGVITAQSFYGDGANLTNVGVDTATVVTDQLYVTGIATVGTGLTLADSIEARFGDAGDLRIYHDGSHSYIHDGGTGDLKIQGADDVVIEDTAGANSAVFNTDGAVELYYRGTSAGKKFETTTSGVIVTGVTTSTTTVIVGSGVTISVAGVHASSGIVTASSFEGSGSALTGLPAGFNWVDGSLF